MVLKIVSKVWNLQIISGMNLLVFLLLQFVFLNFSAASEVSSVNSCAYLFLTENRPIELKYRELNIDLSVSPQEVREFLESVPPFLLSPYYPRYEDLRSTDLKPFSGNLELTKKQLVDQSVFHPDQIILYSRQVLAVFQFSNSDSNYYFVGSGNYIPYLIARTLFEGTPLESRIKFISFSKNLAIIEQLNNEPFERYFNSLDIGKDQKRKIVLIDSVTEDAEPNTNSLIILSNTVRKYLMSKGWDERKAIDSVITVGIPEFGKRFQTFRYEKLDDYFMQLSKINLQNFNQIATPYLDPGIIWRNSVFFRFYSSVRGESVLYWNRKFKTLDAYGFPVGETDIRNSLRDTNVSAIENYVKYKSLPASFYQDIINHTLQNKNKVQHFIHSTVITHSPHPN